MHYILAVLTKTDSPEEVRELLKPHHVSAKTKHFLVAKEEINEMINVYGFGVDDVKKSLTNVFASVLMSDLEFDEEGNAVYYWNDKAKWDYYDLGPYVVDKNGEKSDFCKVKDAVLTEDQYISEILLPDGIWLFDKPNRNYADVASIINNLGSELYVSLLNCHI